MRGRLDEIRAVGAELVFVGSGSPAMAARFQEREAPDVRVLTDPSRESFRDLGMKRGVARTLGPRTWIAAARALATGHRQTALQGDAWQQGGLYAMARGGEIVFAAPNEHAGVRPDLDAALAALRGRESDAARRPTIA